MRARGGACESQPRCVHAREHPAEAPCDIEPRDDQPVRADRDVTERRRDGLVGSDVGREDEQRHGARLASELLETLGHGVSRRVEHHRNAAAAARMAAAEAGSSAAVVSKPSTLPTSASAPPPLQSISSARARRMRAAILPASTVFPAPGGPTSIRGARRAAWLHGVKGNKPESAVARLSIASPSPASAARRSTRFSGTWGGAARPRRAAAHPPARGPALRPAAVHFRIEAQPLLSSSKIASINLAREGQACHRTGTRRRQGRCPGASAKGDHSVDIFELLRKDHRAVEALFDDIATAEDSTTGRSSSRS